jgi:hypothetical protein
VYEPSITRSTGKLNVSLPPFQPLEGVAAPAGTTHFQIVCGGCEVDFSNETFVADMVQSAVLPWDAGTTAAMNLETTVTANSPHPLFLVLGLSFFQSVNGTLYPLKNGTFNALAVVMVSGV